MPVIKSCITVTCILGLMGCASAGMKKPEEPKEQASQEKTIPSAQPEAKAQYSVNGVWVGTEKSKNTDGTSSEHRFILEIHSAQFSEHEIKKVPVRADYSFLSGLFTIDAYPKRKELNCPYPEELYTVLSGYRHKDFYILTGENKTIYEDMSLPMNFRYITFKVIDADHIKAKISLFGFSDASSSSREVVLTREQASSKKF